MRCVQNRPVIHWYLYGQLYIFKEEVIGGGGEANMGKWAAVTWVDANVVRTAMILSTWEQDTLLLTS